MPKELCKLKKSLMKDDLDAYCKLVDKPTVVCEKCGRVANKKKFVCKPRALNR